jgi:site-specific recombinase XerD
VFVVLLGQITEEQVRGWFAALPLMPTAIGTLRSPSTVESYARSARAFCQWLVRHRYLPATPFAHLLLPQVENRLLRPLEPEEWERLLLACHPPKETGVLADRATARNRAILWVLFDTGMQATEVCRLRLCDVDQEQGTLRVRGKGSQQRRLTLGQEGLRHLLAYLDDYRLGAAACGEQGGTSEAHLFLSETGCPLTKTCVQIHHSMKTGQDQMQRGNKSGRPKQALFCIQVCVRANSAQQERGTCSSHVPLPHFFAQNLHIH